MAATPFSGTCAVKRWSVQSIHICCCACACHPVPNLHSYLSLHPSNLPSSYPHDTHAALIGYIESLAIARSVAAQTGGYAIDDQQELCAVGVCNLAVGLAQGYPVTGSFSRTAVLASSGAKSPMASILAGIGIIPVLLWATSALSQLPKVATAAIVMTVVNRLIQAPAVRALWRSDKRDFLVYAIVFIITITQDVVPGLIAGVLVHWLIGITRSFTTKSTLRLMQWQHVTAGSGRSSDDGLGLGIIKPGHGHGASTSSAKQVEDHDDEPSPMHQHSDSSRRNSTVSAADDSTTATGVTIPGISSCSGQDRQLTTTITTTTSRKRGSDIVNDGGITSSTSSGSIASLLLVSDLHPIAASLPGEHEGFLMAVNKGYALVEVKDRRQLGSKGAGAHGLAADGTAAGVDAHANHRPVTVVVEGDAVNGTAASQITTILADPIASAAAAAAGGPVAADSGTDCSSNARTAVATLSFGPDLQFAQGWRLRLHVEEVLSCYGDQLAAMVLDFSHVAVADSTGAVALFAAVQHAVETANVPVAAAATQSQVLQTLLDTASAHGLKMQLRTSIAPAAGRGNGSGTVTSEGLQLQRAVAGDLRFYDSLHQAWAWAANRAAEGIKCIQTARQQQQEDNQVTLTHVHTSACPHGCHTHRAMNIDGVVLEVELAPPQTPPTAAGAAGTGIGQEQARAATATDADADAAGASLLPHAHAHGLVHFRPTSTSNSGSEDGESSDDIDGHGSTGDADGTPHAAAIGNALRGRVSSVSPTTQTSPDETSAGKPTQQPQNATSVAVSTRTDTTGAKAAGASTAEEAAKPQEKPSAPGGHGVIGGGSGHHQHLQGIPPSRWSSRREEARREQEPLMEYGGGVDTALHVTDNAAARASAGRGLRVKNAIKSAWNGAHGLWSHLGDAQPVLRLEAGAV